MEGCGPSDGEVQVMSAHNPGNALPCRDTVMGTAHPGLDGCLKLN